MSADKAHTEAPEHHDPLLRHLTEWTKQVGEQPPSRVAAGIADCARKYHEQLNALPKNTRLTPPTAEPLRSTADRCNAAMVFKKDWESARPMELEPWYCHWVSELTAQGLHDKADIATVLAILSKRLADGSTTPSAVPLRSWVDVEKAKADAYEAAALICEEMSYPPEGQERWHGTDNEWAAIKLEDAAKAIRERKANVCQVTQAIATPPTELQIK